MKGVNVILKGKKSDKHAYLKISYRHSGKTKVISLGLKIKKTDFNPRTQRVRSSNKDFQNINNTIEDKLLSLQLLPYQRNRINSLCSYMKIIIDRTIVRGTKEKYTNIYNLFILFLEKEYNKSDILFEELNSVMVNKFYIWLRKRNKTNTANYKIKSFKSFINKAKIEGIYIFQINPFISLKLNFEETNKEYLTIDELKKFIQYEHIDNRKTRVKIDLKDIKESFIFSTLGQGLRISDILTLRFNNFYDGKSDFIHTEKDYIYLRKKMMKTKKLVFLTLNRHLCNYIERQVIRVIENFLPHLKNGDNYSLLMSHIDNRIYFKNELDKDLTKVAEKNDIFFEDDKCKDLKDEYERNITDNELQIYYYIILLLRNISNNELTKNRFVFPFLDDNKFLSIEDDNDFSKMTDEQYLQFSGKRSYVNELLKNLFKQCEFDKNNLTFHSSRHSYTTLVLENKKDRLDLYDLQRALGHSSILSTQQYIRSFNLNKIENLNNTITNTIFSNQKKDG